MNEYLFDDEKWDEEDYSGYGEYDEYEEYEEVEVDLSRFPAYPVKPEGVQYGIFITDMLISCSLAKDEKEVSRLIRDGLIYLNDEMIPSVDCIITEEDFWEGYICLRKGENEGRYIVLDL